MYKSQYTLGIYAYIHLCTVTKSCMYTKRVTRRSSWSGAWGIGYWGLTAIFYLPWFCFAIVNLHRSLHRLFMYNFVQSDNETIYFSMQLYDIIFCYQKAEQIIYKTSLPLPCRKIYWLLPNKSSKHT